MDVGKLSNVNHMIDGARMRQKIVCCSPYGAEILAFTGTDDLGYNINLSMGPYHR